MEKNEKRLYDFYMKKGLIEKAEEILKVYPHFKDNSKKEKKK